MSKKPVLVVMAAGMGSRYGGLKQIDPVGNCGEAILDYSLFDAHEAGFETAVIIIKEAIKKDFMDTVGKRLHGGKVIRYQLFPYDADSRAESSQIDVFISGAYEAPDHIPGSRIYLTVLSGMVEVQVGEEKWNLDNRDSIVFSGDQPRKYTNKGNTTVRLVERIMYKK